MCYQQGSYAERCHNLCLLADTIDVADVARRVMVMRPKLQPLQSLGLWVSLQYFHSKGLLEINVLKYKLLILQTKYTEFLTRALVLAVCT